METLIDLSVLLSALSLCYAMLGMIALVFDRFPILLDGRQRRGRQRQLPAGPLQRARPRRRLVRRARPANAVR
jgi:hypothetical protein